MTTRITVTTGDGGLLERNSQQQAANRQGSLVKGQAEKAVALGDEQLRKERIAQGRDPLTGFPLSLAGSTSRLTRIDQKPAAFRSDGLEVTKFYSGQIEGSQSIISGDGTQIVDFELPPSQVIPIYPVLQNTEYSDFDIIYTPGTSSIIEVGQTTRTEGGNINEYTDQNKFFSKRRLIHTKYATNYYSLPLGGGLALLVSFRYSAYASVLLRYYRHFEYYVNNNLPFINRLTLVDQSFTAELETNWVEQEDWIAVVVGNSEARAVSISDSLKDALRLQSVSTQPFTTYSRDTIACTFAGNGFSPITNDYTVPPYVCENYPGVYGYTFYNNQDDKGPPVALIAASPLQAGRIVESRDITHPSYGLVDNGLPLFTNYSTTPSAWFEIDSDTTNEYMENAFTHEALLSASLGAGQLMSSLFSAKQYIDVSESPVSWKGAPITGNVFVYPDNQDPSWNGKVKTNPAIENAYNVHYIYDWSKKSFCASQASRYGISV